MSRKKVPGVSEHYPHGAISGRKNDMSEQLQAGIALGLLIGVFLCVVRTYDRCRSVPPGFMKEQKQASFLLRLLAFAVLSQPLSLLIWFLTKSNLWILTDLVLLFCVSFGSWAATWRWHLPGPARGDAESFRCCQNPLWEEWHDLDHAQGFDFGLARCSNCRQYVMSAWTPHGPVGGIRKCFSVTAEDARDLLKVPLHERKKKVSDWFSRQGGYL